jgi:hypothetical protein
MTQRIKPGLFKFEVVPVGPKNNLDGQTPPNIDDDKTKGYSKGSLWLDHVSLTVYFCFNARKGAAKWIKLQEGQIEWSFFENFENGWFISYMFSKLFSEDFEWSFTDNFEVNWFIYNLFSTIFADNFETSWKDPGTYALQMSDDFKTNWFINNLFTSIFTESFGINWFINNLFTSLLFDNFETNWFISNLFTQLYTENFEDGGF